MLLVTEDNLVFIVVISEITVSRLPFTLDRFCVSELIRFFADSKDAFIAEELVVIADWNVLNELIVLCKELLRLETFWVIEDILESNVLTVLFIAEVFDVIDEDNELKSVLKFSTETFRLLKLFVRAEICELKV